MKTAYRHLLIPAFLLSLGSSLNAGALDNWSNKNPAGGATLNEIAYGAGIFVVVGDAGMVLTSADTTNWVAHISGSPQNLYGVAYSHTTFVAVGDGGALLTSVDGTNWLVLDSITDQPLYRVTYGNGTFVAVGDMGTVLASTDGTNWNKKASATTNSLAAVTFADGMFVAVGGLGTILTSTNAITWTSHNSGTNAYLRGVTHGENTFVVVGDAGTILTSQNTSRWTSNASGTTDDLLDVTYLNSTFVIVGGSFYSDYPYGPNSTAILTSSDATKWATQSAPMPNVLNGAGFGGGAFAAVGDQGTILVSIDAANWACRAFADMPSQYYGLGPRQATFGNGTFILGGYYTPFYTSPDGVNWSAHWPPQMIGSDAGIVSILYARGIFVADAGLWLLTSSDGATWTTAYSSSTDVSGAIAYGNGRFVLAVEDLSNPTPTLSFLTSPDATNWTARTLGSNIFGQGYIAFGNGEFIVPASLGTQSAFLISSNGIDWHTNIVAYDRGSTFSLQTQLVFGNGLFLYILPSGSVLTSPDWSNWTTLPPVNFSSYDGFSGNLTFGNGEFMLSTTNGVATSVDGVSWVNHDLTGSLWQLLDTQQPTQWLLSLAYGNGRFVGVRGSGLGGTIVTSASVENPRLSAGRFSANSTFQMAATGQPDHKYAVATSTNLGSWLALTNFISSDPVSTVVDPGASDFKTRFYRAIEQ